MHFQHPVLNKVAVIWSVSTAALSRKRRRTCRTAARGTETSPAHFRRVRMCACLAASARCPEQKCRIVLFHTGRSATRTNALSCSSRSTRGVHTDSRIPEGGVARRRTQSRSISLRSDSRPSKGLHGCWNGLHGMVGFHRTTAIIPLLLPHPCCHCGQKTVTPSASLYTMTTGDVEGTLSSPTATPHCCVAYPQI